MRKLCGDPPAPAIRCPTLNQQSALNFIPKPPSVTGHLDCLVMANSRNFNHLPSTLPLQKYLLERQPVYLTVKTEQKLIHNFMNQLVKSVATGERNALYQQI
ncbi:hypothetical protein EIZ48_27735 [Photobacterium alginatilyticum]|uniref:LysR substrate-binding domain-containing protein n=1 Tax=Photobacterium alginatilyticum TaxID=1775171 RepID=A0ABW9YRE6_9GAMM|nr:hypothetical protein [Photobacterium alginatilyticum]